VGVSALINPVKGISAELVERGPIEEGYEILIGLKQTGPILRRTLAVQAQPDQKSWSLFCRGEAREGEKRLVLHNACSA
jgi:hypothetical protein